MDVREGRGERWLCGKGGEGVDVREERGEGEQRVEVGVDARIIQGEREGCKGNSSWRIGPGTRDRQWLSH